MKIALCSGHHKIAKGAVNKKHGLNEHDEAVKVNAYLADKLRSFGHTVDEIGGTLSEKIAKINAGCYTLALDNHFNAGGGRGCEVIHVPSSPTRHEQAKVMSASIATYMGLKDRGAKGGWHRMDQPGVVDYPGDIDGDEHMDAFVARTDCPAFIPEPFFMDNNAEVEYWLVAGRHAQIADAIAVGITDSFGG